MGYLNQHLLGHTYARLGFSFANKEIDVVEVTEIEGEVELTPELESEVTVTPVLEGELECHSQP